MDESQLPLHEVADVQRLYRILYNKMIEELLEAVAAAPALKDVPANQIISEIWGARWGHYVTDEEMTTYLRIQRSGP